MSNDYLLRGSDYLKKIPNFKLKGRSKELKALSAILMRKRSNNVLLVGPGGVGITALCLGLQASKEDTDVPFDIVGKRFYWLETDNLFSSGDSQVINQGFQKAIGTLKRHPGSVIIIEDTRDFIEACRNSGNNHLINALLSIVKSDTIQAIFEIRDEDLLTVMSAHSDLKECFTLMDLEEPVGEALKEIIFDSAISLSEYHKIKISDEAIQTAITLTTKYRTKDASLSRAQPERAVTLLDRSLSSYRFSAHSTPPQQNQEQWYSKQEQIKKYFGLQRQGEKAILELEDQLEKQIKADESKLLPETSERPVKKSALEAFGNIASAAGYESEAVQELRKKIETFQILVNENRIKFDEIAKEIDEKLELTKVHVQAKFSEISGIPADKLNENEVEKLIKLDETIKKGLFGQDHAVEQISAVIRVSKFAATKKKKKDNAPVSFLCCGPSGVGKTEIAKQLSGALLDDAEALTRFDMSEYMEKHAVARMIGCPPGYDGYDPEGGILTRLMRKNPNRIILFDEIEKAHPDLFNIFLQILSDGRLTDPIGRVLDFSNSIIIMTTNIGQSIALDISLSEEDIKKKTIEELLKTYRSEFLNRFGGRENIICFNSLNLDSIQKIVRREVNMLNDNYSDNVKTIFDQDSLIAFCNDNYDPAIGARGLPAKIKKSLETPIVDKLLSSQEYKGVMNVSYHNGKFDVVWVDEKQQLAA